MVPQVNAIDATVAYRHHGFAKSHALPSTTHAPTNAREIRTSQPRNPRPPRSRLSSGCTGDDVLGERTELRLQRLEVEAERRDDDARQADLLEPLDAVEVERAATGHFDRVG